MVNASGKLVPCAQQEMAERKKSGCGYLQHALSIVVVGASGDLAKKKVTNVCVKRVLRFPLSTCREEIVLPPPSRLKESRISRHTDGGVPQQSLVIAIEQ